MMVDSRKSLTAPVYKKLIMSSSWFSTTHHGLDHDRTILRMGYVGTLVLQLSSAYLAACLLYKGAVHDRSNTMLSQITSSQTSNDHRYQCRSRNLCLNLSVGEFVISWQGLRAFAIYKGGQCSLLRVWGDIR